MSAEEFPLRTDSYQTGKGCAAVIYTRGHTVENVQLFPEVKSLKIEADVDGKRVSRVWAWAGEVDPSSCKLDQGKVKIEVTLQKTTAVMWPKAEADAAEAAPLYARWNQMAFKEEEEKVEGLEAFLRKCYRDADEDSRRAMIKSMVESKGTVFNPVWKEVGNKTVEVYKSKEEKEKEEQEAKEREERAKKALEAKQNK